MEKKVAILGIILKSRESVEELNSILSEYGDFIIGRMGIPYKAKALNIISIALDAPENTTKELSKKIERLDGISVNIAYSNI